MIDDGSYETWGRIRFALHEWLGKTWDGDNLSEAFVRRLDVLCAVSMLTMRQSTFALMYSYDWTPAQLQKWTGQRQPEQSRCRHLSIREIATITGWSERLVKFELARTRRRLEWRLDTSCALPY